jgi:hypothetical protein
LKPENVAMTRFTRRAGDPLGAIIINHKILGLLQRCAIKNLSCLISRSEKQISLKLFEKQMRFEQTGFENNSCVCPNGKNKSMQEVFTYLALRYLVVISGVT